MIIPLVSKNTAERLHLSLLQVRTFGTQRLPVCLPLRAFFSAMSGSPDLQPQKRVLVAEESENLSSSKKPRLVEETIPQAESSSTPLILDASPREDVKDLVDTRMAADRGGEDLIQTEKANRPSDSELGGGNQSKGKKKKFRPPRGGHRSRNEEDEERGTLLSPTGKMEPAKTMRLPKRLCALLLGFCGSGYRGMQM